jgi:hypothetical protein
VEVGSALAAAACIDLLRIFRIDFFGFFATTIFRAFSGDLTFVFFLRRSIIDIGRERLRGRCRISYRRRR